MFVTCRDIWGFSSSVLTCNQGKIQTNHSESESESIWHFHAFHYTLHALRMVCKHRSILMSMHCIELTCLTTGDDPLCLASQRGTNARRRPRRSRMLRSPFWFLRPDMAGFPWMERTSLSDCQIRSIQKLNSVFASEMRNYFEILLWNL